jgi:hypothetical protein
MAGSGDREHALARPGPDLLVGFCAVLPEFQEFFGRISGRAPEPGRSMANQIVG